MFDQLQRLGDFGITQKICNHHFLSSEFRRNRGGWLDLTIIIKKNDNKTWFTKSSRGISCSPGPSIDDNSRILDRFFALSHRLEPPTPPATVGIQLTGGHGKFKPPAVFLGWSNGLRTPIIFYFQWWQPGWQGGIAWFPLSLRKYPLMQVKLLRRHSTKLSAHQLQRNDWKVDGEPSLH